MASIELSAKLPSKHKISFVDLKTQQQALRLKLDIAIAKVLDHGLYILGPEVAELEATLAQFCGVKHVISCANGTDALILGLMAQGCLTQQDAIFVPTFTFSATAEAIVLSGGTPVFIDVLPDTFNMDPASLEQGIQLTKKLGYKPRGIIPVDLFGQPANYQMIETLARKNQLWVMADGAQSFGASYKGKRVGNIGKLATTSFFPVKPLGCYGDGGAVFTNDDEISQIIKSLRVHGQGTHKYDNVRIGLNSRLDTLQAAILLEKLKIFEKEIKQRNDIATRYNNGLKDVVRVPCIMEDTNSVWAQYTIRLPSFIQRTQIVDELHKLGIPTMIYYVTPLHLQTAYRHYPRASESGLVVSEQLSQEVLSLPMHPYLDPDQQDYIIHAIKELCQI